MLSCMRWLIVPEPILGDRPFCSRSEAHYPAEPGRLRPGSRDPDNGLTRSLVAAGHQPPRLTERLGLDRERYGR
jgi:hypothetical protein